MGWPITINGRYGKSRKVQSITFDSDRVDRNGKLVHHYTYKDKTEHYIWVKHEGRKITFATEDDLTSFIKQLDPRTQEASDEQKHRKPSMSLPKGLSFVKAVFIDANEYAMLKAGDNFTQDNVNKLTFLVQSCYMFELPRVGERFNAHGVQWKVEEFVKTTWDDIRIYARMVMDVL